MDAAFLILATMTLCLAMQSAVYRMQWSTRGRFSLMYPHCLHLRSPARQDEEPFNGTRFSLARWTNRQSANLVKSPSFKKWEKVEWAATHSKALPWSGFVIKASLRLSRRVLRMVLMTARLCFPPNTASSCVMEGAPPNDHLTLSRLEAFRALDHTLVTPVPRTSRNTPSSSPDR